jgi:putative ABC transport system permease protein
VTRAGRIVLGLALRDLLAERVLSLCLAVAVAAVLAPLLVLGGLRLGAINALRQSLLENPHGREIVTEANRTFDATLLARLAARPDVQFLVPRTRTLAASLLLERPGEPAAGVRVELIPSAPGDPLLPAAPTRSDQIVLSAAAAAELGVTAGAPLIGRLGRIMDGHIQDVALPLTVMAVAAPAAFSREGAYVTLALALFVEDFQEGRSGAPADLSRLPLPKQESFAGFRLYARQLEEVPELDRSLRAQGIDVASHAADVAGILQIDRGLSLLFALVAGLGGCGFLVSLGAGLWASVERKRTAFALLRLIGLRSASLRIYPVAQAVILAAIGVGIACAAALIAADVINWLFAGVLATGRPLCIVTLGLAALCGSVTLGGAAAVALLAGIRLSHLEPWEAITTP